MIRQTIPVYHYARLYDLMEVFCRNQLANALERVPFQPGDRVLDIGVGTGFSLKHFPANVRVTGVDRSPDMLSVARRKVAAGRVDAAVELLEGDALALPFPAGTFDVVLLSHVITEVADSDRCLEEAVRVARESAILVLVNHFRSQHPILRRLERAMNPICQRLGWRSDLSLGGLLYRANATYDQMACQGGFGRILYLQKWRGKLRVIHLPAPEVINPTRVLANAGPGSADTLSRSELGAGEPCYAAAIGKSANSLPIPDAA